MNFNLFSVLAFLALCAIMVQSTVYDGTDTGDDTGDFDIGGEQGNNEGDNDNSGGECGCTKKTTEPPTPSPASNCSSSPASSNTSTASTNPSTASSYQSTASSIPSTASSYPSTASSNPPANTESPCPCHQVETSPPPSSDWGTIKQPSIIWNKEYLLTHLPHISLGKSLFFYQCDKITTTSDWERVCNSCGFLKIKLGITALGLMRANGCLCFNI